MTDAIEVSRHSHLFTLIMRCRLPMIWTLAGCPRGHRAVEDAAVVAAVIIFAISTLSYCWVSEPSAIR